MTTIILPPQNNRSIIRSRRGRIPSHFTFDAASFPKVTWDIFTVIRSAAWLILLSIGSASAAPVFWNANGHYYEFVRTNITWPDARSAASNRTHEGLPGHLATITSVEENQFITTNLFTGVFAEFAWLGGREPADNGVWRWDVGPEAGAQFSFARLPTAPFHFANWGGNEPTDLPREDSLVLNIGTFYIVIPTGTWGDAPPDDSSGLVVGFIVEYEAVSPPPTRLDIFPAVELVFVAERNKTYQLQFNDQLGMVPWTNFGAALIGDGSTNVIFDTTRRGAKRFYRLLTTE